ncbi:MAG: dihydroorotate dehydrogenase catalytic subunit [Candidatus Binatota bacterium]|nr:dihydroorotate dehydrogenase catalytic subunit [Candidatus Binatota bacterium]
MAQTPRVEVEVGGGLKLRNPVVAASGTFGYGVEYFGVAEPHGLGAVVVKGLSARPSRGHPAPRMVETSAGMLNAIGLQNIGAEAFVRDKLPQLRRSGVTVVANCWGNTVEEYGEVAEMLDVANGLAALEINVSSPNKREWGGIIATDPVRTADVVRTVRGRTRLPLWVKLSPNVTDIVELARVAEGEGADALVVANTYTGMAVDLRTRRPVLTNVTGGLSGPAIKPLSLRATYQVTRAVSVPVIGVGGISTGEDALEYLLVGARAVQVGTANLYDPAATTRIVHEIESFLRREAIPDVNDLVGGLIVN